MKSFERYCRILGTFSVVSFCLRIYEAVSVYAIFGVKENLLLHEALGFVGDIALGITILLIFFPIYSLIAKKHGTTANVVWLSFIGFFSTVHFVLLQYFLNQFKPLGAFLYKYSYDEILFTISTSDQHYLKIALILLVMLAIIPISYFILKKISFSKKAKYPLLVICVACVIYSFFAFSSHLNEKYDNLTKSKSLVFYYESIDYLINKDEYCTFMTAEEIHEYHSMLPEKHFVSDEYPLLHERDTVDYLGKYFEKFDSKPNIVILIVEGLNEQFVHDYMDVNLMPFLRDLIGSGLYWRNNFATAERSFSAVPSILGSLPYGEIGFTLLDKLPRHVTLTSILGANGYQTNFFYGQGAWFHKKNKFFQTNNISCIADNSTYSEKYPKVIVGDDNYFWGYDDKSLFGQSLEIIDTLPSKPRLDVYFTGTTHSPFVYMTDEDYYQKYFDSIVEGMKNSDEKDFFKKHSKYIKTLFFLDDALRDFFESYSKRDDYANTMFVITGDHSMSEIPFGNTVRRYHVPFVIYSEKLRQPKVFDNFVSYADFFETILPFLRQYGVEAPTLSPAFGENLFGTRKKVAFMNEPRQIVDYYSDGYYLSEGKLYTLTPDYEQVEVKDKELLKKMSDELRLMKQVSEYTAITNRVMPDSLYAKYLDLSLVHSFKANDNVCIENEYYSIIPKVDVTDYDTLYFDVAFNNDFKSDAITLVLELVDGNGKNLYYNNYGSGADYGFWSHHVVLGVPKMSNGVACKMYFWNKDKSKVVVSDLSCCLTGR